MGGQLNMVINNLKEKKISKLSTIESTSGSDITPFTNHINNGSGSNDSANHSIPPKKSNDGASDNILIQSHPTAPSTLQLDLPNSDPIPMTPPRSPSPTSKSTYYEHETTAYPDDYEAMEIISQACGSCFLIVFCATFAALVVGKLENGFSAFWVIL